MSLSITLFGPRHYWWWAFRDGQDYGGHRARRVWVYRPDELSSGGIGFCIPGLHVCFKWGKGGAHGA